MVYDVGPKGPQQGAPSLCPPAQDSDGQPGAEKSEAERDRPSAGYGEENKSNKKSQADTRADQTARGNFLDAGRCKQVRDTAGPFFGNCPLW
ncbi:hypothetical protein ARTHRO9AX_180338 [Arthrobacter sp. 9AX]|nr:hypothetical protein ARTHRO9AX_180338 [Arthrobacter sp. 9AX]